MRVTLRRSLVGAGGLVVVVVLGGCASAGRPAGQTSIAPAQASAPATVTSPAAKASASKASPQQVAARSPAAQPNTVHLGGARLNLPPGWVAGFEQPKGGSSNILPTWCLSPTPLPSPVYVDQDCAATFSTVPFESLLSVDTPGGIVSNPEYCQAGYYTTDALLEYRDAQLGDRPADYRRWLFVCRDGNKATGYTVLPS